MLNQIREAVASNKERIIDLLRDMVRINSENHPPGGNERAVQDFIAGVWAEAGIEFDAFSPSLVPGFTRHPGYFNLGRDYQDRPVVVAKIAGEGGGRSLILSGHVDTVPVGEGQWRHGPFSGDIEDGKLYGRGSFDMKGGSAAMIMAGLLLSELGIELGGDLYIETVPDEEFASGNGTVAARARGYAADAAVVGEPTGLAVVTGHRGFRLAQLSIAGKTGIPVFAGEMTNPVEHLAPVLRGIEEFRAARLPITGEDTVMITKLAANRFVPDELLTVPPECRIEVYWQVLPEEEIADVDAAFEATIRAACSSDSYFNAQPLEISYHLRPLPGSRVGENHPLVGEACAAVQAITGQPADVFTAFPPCDMFVFNRFAGIPAVVIGPGGGNAHAPDEYVNVDDVVKCVEIYAALALSWCGVSRD